MRPFGYLRARTLEEAVEAMTEGGTLLAGGQSLIPQLKADQIKVSRVVDLSGLSGLDSIEEDETSFHIGAMVTHARLADVGGLLGQAASVLGDIQVRNRGTLGGSLAHRDPRADYYAVLLACDARLSVWDGDGQNTLSVEDYLHSPHSLLVEKVSVPKSDGHYRRLADRAVGWALAGVCLTEGRIGVTGVGDHPYRARASEEALSRGQTQEAVDSITHGATVRDDLEASAPYRAHMAGLILSRLLDL
jgi:aerobic carbon-monoxide dehydrogenase medium subunit